MANVLRDYIIGGIIFTMIIMIVVTAVTLVDKGDPLSDGSTSITSFAEQETITSFNRSFNKYAEISSNLTALHTTIRETKPILGSDTIALGVAFVQTIWGGITLVIGMFGFMDSVYEGFSSFLGIPQFIVNLTIFIVLTVLIFAIISLIFGKDT